MKKIRYRNWLTAAAMATGLLAADMAAAEETQYFPIASSRVGPYSAMGR